MASTGGIGRDSVFFILLVIPFRERGEGKGKVRRTGMEIKCMDSLDPRCLFVILSFWFGLTRLVCQGHKYHSSKW